MVPGSRELPYQGNIVFITDHAIEQFMKRWKSCNDYPLKPEEVITTIRELFARTVPDTKLLPQYRVERIINNNFNPAEYMTFGGWRFVIVREKETAVLATIERIAKPSNRQWNKIVSEKRRRASKWARG